MVLNAGFCALGFLVGYLAGLNSSPIAATLLGTVFSFAGGTVFHFVNASKVDRKLAGNVLSAFSICCVVGLTIGIVIKENRLFTSLERQAALAQLYPSYAAAGPGDYLKGLAMTEVRAINQQYVSGEISAAVAYERLRKLTEGQK